jgi:hypothetical protein
MTTLQDISYAAKDLMYEAEALHKQLKEMLPADAQAVIAPELVEQGKADAPTAKSYLAKLNTIQRRGWVSPEAMAVLTKLQGAIKSGQRSLTRTEKRVINETYSLLFTF